MWRTPATLRGTLDDVPNARRRVAMILAHRDELRRHLRRGRRRPAATIRANVISSQGVHDRYGGVVPEVASRHHLELVNAVVDDALRPRRRDARRRRPRRRHPGPGPGRRAARRRRRRPRRSPPRAACRSRPSTTSRATSPPTSCAPRRRSSRRSSAWSPRGGHTFLARVEDHAGYSVLGADARRRRRRGVRQGRAAARPAYPGGPALERAGRARATRTPSTSRSRRGVAGLDFSFAGLKTALLYKVRDLGEERASARAPTSPPPTSARSSSALALRVERGAGGRPDCGAWRSAAAWPPTGPLRERAGRARRRPSTSRRASCAPTTPR